jgi:formate dehydrogenase alpha subunit
VTGLVAAFGSGAMTNSIEDIVTKAKAYFVIGSNTTEQHPVIGIQLRKAVRDGARLILADPRRIDLANHAMLHLKHRPGSDIALLNALMNVLIAEDLYDRDFVGERTEGFEELRQAVQEYTPEYAETITNVPAADIRTAARILAANKPASLLYAMGITQHTTGHQNVLSCANLQMLLGNMGLPGGGVNPLRGQNNVQGACDMACLPNFYPGYQKVVDPATRDKFAQAWGDTGSTEVGLTIVEMLNGAEAGDVKAMFILAENPMMTDPDVNHVRKCLQSLDLLVVQEIFMSETAELADVVLPGACFAEKDGTFTNSERRVQRVRKAVNPPGKALPDWQIICDLAKRVEVRLARAKSEARFGGWDYAHPSEVMAEINALAPIYGGVTYERIEQEGLQWPCRTTEDPGTPILHVGQFSRGLGKFHGVEWQSAKEMPDDQYPFLLTTGRVLFHFHGGSMTRRSAGLDEIYPEALIEINPQDARQLSIGHGDMVRVASRRGEVVAKAEVVDRPDPGVVFMTFHFQEAPANVLTIAALDPVAKIPEYKVAAVRIEPLTEKVPAAP